MQRLGQPHLIDNLALPATVIHDPRDLLQMVGGPGQQRQVRQGDLVEGVEIYRRRFWQANSRMKDFFDLAVIARRTPPEGATLAAAIAATFARRRTALPAERPLVLTRRFSDDPAKARQWQAFLSRNRIEAASLGDTVTLLDELLWPPTQVAAAGSQATATWRPESLQRV